MKFHEGVNIKPETLEYTKKKVESGLDAQMPINFSKLKSITESNELTKKAFNEMLKYAQSYVADVWKMKELLSKKNEYTEEEWAKLFSDADDARTRLHDTYIDSIAILLRNMNNMDMETDWARELMPSGKLDRVRCGNFAIMLTYSQYVNSTSGK